ncbi:MAG: lysophospholipid acyltransferase family protein [Desulfomonilia bacterium]|jgi:1-acyl-sn-glycerol-3-phosphate acyltransferase
MITDILYRCPSCGGFDWMDGGRCIHCGALVKELSRTEISVDSQRQTIGHWYRRTLDFDLPPARNGLIMQSGPATLSRETVAGVYQGFGGVKAVRYTRTPCDEGSLSLNTEGLVFTGRSRWLEMPFKDLLGLTIESYTIILTSRAHGILFIDFRSEPGKKWEDCIRKALSAFYAPRLIHEFYPRIRFNDQLRERPARAEGRLTLKVPTAGQGRSESAWLLRTVKTLAGPAVRALFSANVSGLENIPKTGAAVLMPNHTSFLDSIILGALPGRNIWFMAKNSEYRNPLLTWALRQARSFPVRRYAVDVQAVRNAIRIVQQGHILGIYPEGERTWDNTLLPFRSGTMRLVLALGKPVIPVGITGAYELMPRWTSSIKRTRIEVRIGAPLMLDHIPIPRQTRMDILEAERVLKEHIRDLSGENH